MQIQVKPLLNELEWVNKFRDKKATIPIIGNVLFDVDGNRLTLTATDLEVGGVTTVEGSGAEQWSCAVPVSKLIKYLGKVDEPEVTIKTVDNWLIVSHGRDITRIAGMSKESYPELPKSPDPLFSLGRLPLAIERTAFAISAEESRFTLNGALLEIDGAAARLISTDGHRLSLAPLKAVPLTEETKFRALIPKFALLEAGKLDDGCSVTANNDFIFLSWGQRRIVSRKLTGNFPDWQRVMPKDAAHHVMLPVASTLKTLDRVALYADERSHAVRFQVGDGKLTMYTSTVEQGEAQGIIPYQAGEVGTPFEIGLNASYVTDFLRRVKSTLVAFCYQADDPDTTDTDGTVRKGKGGNTRAVSLATGDGWQIAVMPMRL